MFDSALTYDLPVTPDYQNFVPAYPRFPLAAFPSPLQRVERLEQALRAEGCNDVPRLYLKRDDLLSLALGGNKIRNLEFLIGEALHRGATDVLTAGRQQSNHCRLTAAACARAGLRAHLVVTGMPPTRATGNLLLDRLLGARIYFTGNDERALRDAWIGYLAPGFESLNRVCYTIPVGGSDARGAIGHALAAQELTRQCEEVGERPTTVILATATGGTQAGMLAGFRKLGSGIPLIGFAVAKTADELRAVVTDMTNAVARDIGGPAVDERDVIIEGSALGASYGAPTTEGQAAIHLLARTEGVLADPVYTGKGLAGLLSLVRAGRFTANDMVIFIHTGGAPALFAQ